jgi:undecaprenyl-diphosphatase
VAVAIASAAVNGALKFGWRRRRPRVGRKVPDRGLLPLPSSSSFPSGHAASAFAFATAVSAELPALRVPLGGLAAIVAYSRIHTGVHYPGDVVAGATIGMVAGAVAGRVVDAAGKAAWRWPPRSRSTTPNS